MEVRQQAVLDLLRAAGLPLWSRDRPASLLWFGVDDSSTVVYTPIFCNKAILELVLSLQEQRAY